MDIYAQIRMQRDELIQDADGNVHQMKVQQYTEILIRNAKSKKEAMDRVRANHRCFEKTIGPIVLREKDQTSQQYVGFYELEPIKPHKLDDVEFTIERDGFVFEGTSPF
jgi:hypothetical protein